jgi:pseudouridine-5'-phosphate glycosidase
MTGSAFIVSPQVSDAIRAGRAVVALESALLTHGLPRPENLQVLLAMREAVRAEGAVPAEVALLRGAVHVGLGVAGIEHLAAAERVEKVGLADLPALSARGASGGTTVAATLWAANRAGIRVFATGGIGGVHRGAENSFDVSGDLAALARFGGCIVCSGAKAVLDLPKTVEVLETLGVCLVGFGTCELPAFTCRESGIQLAHRVETPAEAAWIVRARDCLGLPQAVLVANPPPENSALPATALERALRPALDAAAAQGVRGKELTPFLLRALADATGGASLRANRALLVENARLASRIAGELAPPAI